MEERKEEEKKDEGRFLTIEKVLELLVGKVDAKLLQAVLLEVLEPKDVQDPNILGFPDQQMTSLTLAIIYVKSWP